MIQNSGVIAYPTEAIYGLGCNPFDARAVERLCAIKNRPTAKGLILIAANYAQIAYYIGPIPESVRERCFSSWPGPITWVFPASDKVPKWLCGKRETIALRITAHPLAAALCRIVGYPLISTSANRSGACPLRTALGVRRVFGSQLDFILTGALGGRIRPTPIYDALTGDVLRPN